MPTNQMEMSRIRNQTSDYGAVLMVSAPTLGIRLAPLLLVMLWCELSRTRIRLLWVRKGQVADVCAGHFVARHAQRTTVPTVSSDSKGARYNASIAAERNKVGIRFLGISIVFGGQYVIDGYDWIWFACVMLSHAQWCLHRIRKSLERPRTVRRPPLHDEY